MDSIQPVLKFVKKDIDTMIKTFRWKGEWFRMRIAKDQMRNELKWWNTNCKVH
jgi:hypothetical protein